VAKQLVRSVDQMDYHFVEAIGGDLRMEANGHGKSEDRPRPIRVVLAVLLPSHLLAPR
jgi:hypothetical protein